MQPQTDEIKAVSRLPGYLFILSFITSIGESIILKCQKEDYDLFSSMLNMIDLKAVTTAENSSLKCLYCIRNVHELHNVDLSASCIPDSILYLNKKIMPNNLQNWKNTVLSKYVNSIIITDLGTTGRENYFSIMINKKNIYYTKFKKIFLEQKSAN